MVLREWVETLVAALCGIGAVFSLLVMALAIAGVCH